MLYKSVSFSCICYCFALTFPNDLYVGLILVVCFKFCLFACCGLGLMCVLSGLRTLGFPVMVSCCFYFWCLAAFLGVGFLVFLSFYFVFWLVCIVVWLFASCF